MTREREDFNKLTSTVISKGITINASVITGTDSIRVDGNIIGDIELDGMLQLSDVGRIEGNLHVSSAQIAGYVKGNIVCRSTLHMAATAVIVGDITTASFIVDHGAVLNGLCKTHFNEQVEDRDIN